MEKDDSNGSSLVYALSELSVLRSKYQSLMRMVFGILILWLVTVLLQFVTSASAAKTTEADALRYPQSLQVRELIVVDANGTPRVRIAAPLPDPIMLGKRSKRGDSSSGVLLYDAEGNERGGYVTDEERNVALTLDEINRAAVHLGVNDRGEMHLQLSNGRGGYAAMGVLPSGAWFRLDKPGQPATLLPPTKEENPK
jgi:hypothetical protein